jgi:hypothetical protein
MMSRLVFAMVLGAACWSASADETVLIGCVAPLTGPQAHLGKDIENGVRLAVDAVNATNPTLGGQPVRFEAVRSGQEHHHAVCTSCGAMFEVEHADLASLAAIMLDKYGFHLEMVHLTLSGLCQACASM